MNKKYVLITIICIIFSIILGILSDDLIIGGSILATGLLCAYFASEGKKSNYILGAINYLIMAYVAFKNNLFGITFFYIFVFATLQVYGFISWKDKLDSDNNVKVRGFTLKNSIIIVASCIVGSTILGYLLSLIPGQNLAFLDASSNIIQLCGIVLMNMRFKECWVIWLFNNTIDLIIWIINFIL